MLSALVDTFSNTTSAFIGFSEQLDTTWRQEVAG